MISLHDQIKRENISKKEVADLIVNMTVTGSYND